MFQELKKRSDKTKIIRKKKELPKIRYPILILIATLFISIGYASVNSVILNFEGNASIKEPTGLFITETNYDSNVNADINNSKILNTFETSMNSTISLSKTDVNSTITYEISLYNSTDDDYSFLYYEYLEELYDNSNIIVSLTNLDRGDIIHSKETIKFRITFKYIDDVNLNSSLNVLNSYINFEFKLRPEIVYGSYINGYNHKLNENGETIATSYTSPTTRNGSTWDVVYTMNGVSNYDTSKPEWKIIGYENDQLIITTTDEITSESGRYAQSNRGKIGYTYMIQEMNNICSIYGQGKYADTTKFNYNLDGQLISSGARSMTLADLGYEVETTNKRTYTLKSSATNSSNLVIWYSSPLENPTTMLESEFTKLEYLNENTLSWTSLTNNTSFTMTMKNYQVPVMDEQFRSMIYQGSDGSNLKYFLADRYIDVDDENFGLGRIGYGCPYVQDDQTVFGHGIYWSNGEAAGAPRTVRPVVYLKSNVIIDYDEVSGIYSIS